MRTTRVSKSGRFGSMFRLGSLIYQRFSGRFTSPRRATGTFRSRASIGSLCDYRRPALNSQSSTSKLARVRRELLTAGVAACVFLVGCGGDGETTTVTVGGDAGETQTQAAPRTGSAATTPADEPAASDGPALASRAGTIDAVRVTLEIAELKRSGATTALSLRLTTEADKRAQVAGTFDNGIFDKSRSRDASSISGGSTLDGVFLLDTKNRKKYLVGRDAKNNCACDGDLGGAIRAS